jgi:Mn-dependent DtxR family transcriptional regulator
MKQISEKLSASLEDYLEAIYNLSSDSQFARAKDIALTLDVAKASVTSALRTLAERELINYKPYGYITLTEQGRHLALKIARRHEMLSFFFAEVLGVEPGTAQKAACRTEHPLGPEVVPAEGRIIINVKTKLPNQPISINDVKAGQSVRVASIDAGKGLKGRLAALGILVNAALKIIRNDGAGQIIIQVRQSKIILGRGMTHKILVTEV